MTKNRNDSILIIDDDKSVLSSLSIWLESEGFDVFTSSNSQEAMKILHEKNVDLIILDFKLENETGSEVARIIKENYKNIIIIIITGFPSYSIAVELMKEGVFDYISKGTSNEKILKIIHKGLEQAKKQRIDEADSNKETILSYIIFCNHTLITERLYNFSKENPEYKLIKIFPSFNDIKKMKRLPEVDIALICASCNFDNQNDYYNYFHKYYHHLPSTKPIIFNETFEENDQVELLKIGVKGFLSSDIDMKKLKMILEHIKDGEIWTSRKIATLALQDGMDYLKLYIEGKHSDYNLSDREKEILKAMTLGLKNKEIADRLFISETTVKTHINKIFKKLKVNNRSKAILIAMEQKLI